MKRWLILAAWLASAAAWAQDEPAFSPPGQLEAGSGRGVADGNVYLRDIRFPIEKAPAFLNSQVWRKGGSKGPAGGQCDRANYSYPWRDNFCESRSWGMPLCPSGQGHQGQDIRPATCKAGQHWAVAAEAGKIVQIGKYSVSLQTPAGTVYRYLHLEMGDLAVRRGDAVARGARIGKVSNDFGGAATTIHLHFDIKDSVRVGGRGQVLFVPPYSSLRAAYERLLAGRP
ncbi:M23 family metallopeptidase [Lysobacter sp. BMK333-48F3]|uniref:M23 family metallopeptidase n=1 Tax=Lysobacter sp. BMK333-48F3 TaxID=2867962 RepID=UPI001C8C0CB8|nr:M23 family metallopeptidase [Lysobacter sp. BMK333-48F3]MBX9401218.1 M23 family metallopeptidase [Lysobacter sp. BMK333-48F3]